jgi:hypothetical protein
VKLFTIYISQSELTEEQVEVLTSMGYERQYHQFEVTESQFCSLFSLGIPSHNISVQKFREFKSDGADERISLILDKLEKLVDRQWDVAFNERVQCAVPSNPLLEIDTVELMEDCCTDVVRQMLDEGWRLVAVCPQPTRRPDYIFGRKKPQ